MRREAGKYSIFILSVVLMAAVLAAVRADAADGKWTNGGAGATFNWSDSANWLNSIIADGANGTADFSSMVNPTTDVQVVLDSDRTIGNLIFGDTDPTATPAGWILRDSNLTLVGDKPTITVNTLGVAGTPKNATIGTPLAGTAGLTKAGPGELVLTSNSALTGGINIAAGILNTSAGNAVLAKQIVTLSGGGAWNLVAGTTPQTSGWGLVNTGTAQPPAYTAAAGAVFVSAGESGTLMPTGNVNVGQVGGGAGSTLNVVVPNTTTFQAMGSWATNAPGASNAGGNLGIVNVSVPTAGDTGRFVLNANTANVVNNADRFGVNSLQSTALTIGDGVTMFTRTPSGGNTVALKAISKPEG